MVNLIITLIGIALIAIVAIGVLYSGGDSFRDGKDKSEATQIQNGLNQVYTAYELYIARNGGEEPNPVNNQTLAEFLVEEKYLDEVPKGIDFNGNVSDKEKYTFSIGNNDYIVHKIGSEDKAKAYNKSFGGKDDKIPSCDIPFDPKYPVCKQ